MIQDRLTAKFQSAKPSKRRETKPALPKAVTSKAKGPVTDTYTKGRRIAGSFWL
jgi:hypothetical protein